MAVIESKLKTGKLTLGGTGSPVTGGEEFACQATNVRVVPSFNDEGEPAETLCGDKLSASTTSTWNLQGTSIQDFDSPTGFVKYTWEHNLENIAFSWQPNENETIVSGTVQIRAVEMGGDVNTRITTDFDWPLQGDPTVVWPAVVANGTADAPEDEEPEPEPDAEPVEDAEPYEPATGL